jgi:hypothetical protein
MKALRSPYRAKRRDAMKTPYTKIRAVLIGGVTLFLGWMLVGSAAAQTCVLPPTGLVSW